MGGFCSRVACASAPSTAFGGTSPASQGRIRGVRVGMLARETEGAVFLDERLTRMKDRRGEDKRRSEGRRGNGSLCQPPPPPSAAPPPLRRGGSGACRWRMAHSIGKRSMRKPSGKTAGHNVSEPRRPDPPPQSGGGGPCGAWWGGLPERDVCVARIARFLHRWCAASCSLSCNAGTLPKRSGMDPRVEPEGDEGKKFRNRSAALARSIR